MSPDEDRQISSARVRAIDVHGHFGEYVYQQGDNLERDRFCSGGVDVVLARAKKANAAITVVSPLQALMPRFHGDPVAANEDAFRIVAETPGLRQWVVVDPRKPETYAQAERMLALPHCVGIKVHPEEHGYPIAEQGRGIFEFAAANRLVVQIHSGEQNSMPEDIVPFANEFPEARVILAHLGCGWDGDLTHQVRAICESRHGNVFTDTSSTMSITSRLLEWAIAEVGAERILYGTDTPLYFAPMQRARIDHADAGAAEKRMILRENAVRLFGFDADIGE